MLKTRRKCDRGEGTVEDTLAVLAQIRQANNGVIDAEEAAARGVTTATLSRLVMENKLKRVDKGRYILPTAQGDDLLVMARMDKRAIFSHDTALYLHRLIKSRPEEPSITLPTGHKADPVVRAECKIFYIGDQMIGMGATLVPSPQGNLVPSYDLERTICDVARSRGTIGMDIFLDAMVKYADSPKKDLDKLAEYSDRLMVSYVLQCYLEPLLIAKEAN